MSGYYGFYTAEVGDGHIRALQFVNPTVDEDPSGKYINQHSLMFHTLLIAIAVEVKFCFFNIQVILTFNCGMDFYCFNSHFTTIMQGCYI